MASKEIVKRKASSSPTKTTKRPNFFLDKVAKTRFEDNIIDRGICTPREVNFEFFDKEPGLTVFQMFSFMGWRPFLAIKDKVYPALVKEFYANLSFSGLDGEIVGKSMLRGKKIDLTMKNLCIWIGLKEGDFKRYSTKEPISMEAYSYKKAVKKISGGMSGEIILGQLGWEPNLAFIILSHMKDTLARPNVDLPYGSLITIIARYRGVVFIHDDFCEAVAQAIYDSRLILNTSYKNIDGAWVKIGKPKSKPGEGPSKRKMNVKHGRQPPKAAGRRKSSRLLKKESPAPSSPIQVSKEEKDDTLTVTNTASGLEPEHEEQPDKPNPISSPKSSASSPEPTLDPLTPLAEIRAHLRSLTAQVTTALE
ncbi:Retrovirus-related Pol polyprotein from transposon RE1 [Senna tora]|uniref:Retrovirus-related Pol polyprotein from transposon RE1 n=1 Tax=Senna tora TaxID=362788 RepID=A0A834SGG8_9FABA|nr:Retrovirus-related Pol polyprotein from transposon RE1 [Senna tora]